MNSDRPAIAIVGGGYTGAAFAIHLSRAARRPLDIAIVEPRGTLGAGLAHSADDPDHRLNGPDGVHILFPDAPDDFGDWLRESGALDRDPEAVTDGGRVFPRRSDFGAYMAARVEDHRRSNPSGSRLRHVRDVGVGLQIEEAGLAIELKSQPRLSADVCVVTASHETPAALPVLPQEVLNHPSYVPDPWDLPRIATIDLRDPILILGTALTTADVIATLVRRGHRGRIRAVSRRGLRPRRQPPPGNPPAVWENLTRPVPDFVVAHGTPATAIEVLRALRADIDTAQRSGEAWQGRFDALRDAAHVVWPALRREEKKRFGRHLSAWYSVHRFRTPPQTEAILDQAVSDGLLTFEAATVTSAAVAADGFEVALRTRGQPAPRRETFGAIINCTGPDPRLDAATNPFLRRLLDEGMVRPSDIGVDIDDRCRAIGRDGKPQDRLFVVGPLTRGCVGEVQAVPYITRQIVEALPRVLERIDACAKSASGSEPA